LPPENVETSRNGQQSTQKQRNRNKNSSNRNATRNEKKQIHSLSLRSRRYAFAFAGNTRHHSSRTSHYTIRAIIGVVIREKFRKNVQLAAEQQDIRTSNQKLSTQTGRYSKREGGDYYFYVFNGYYFCVYYRISVWLCDFYAWVDWRYCGLVLGADGERGFGKRRQRELNKF